MIKRLMPSCREVSEKFLVGELFNAPLLQRGLLRLHLMLCEHCRRFSRQLEMISKTVEEIARPQLDPRVVKAAKRRILEHLKPK